MVKPLRPRIKALGDIDLVAPITKFRSDMYGLLKRRWLVITVAQVSVIMTQFLIFYVSLRGVEGWDEAGTSPLAAFGAFATAQIMLMVPITPGGLGTVDAVIIALLQSVGTSAGDATAADLVWRAASYVPQIIIGIIALITWFKKANETFATTAPAPGTDAAPGSHPPDALGVSLPDGTAASIGLHRPGRRGRGSLRRPGLFMSGACAGSVGCARDG